MIIVSLILVSFTNQALAQVVEFNPNKVLDPVVILETNLGKIAIELFPKDAPRHVENFIKLSFSGFYEGTIFHRIIPDFMIQGGDPNTISGDPNTWGTGGPDESVDAEFNTIKHNRGIVSMARSADPNSAGSQFFIVHQDSNFLDEQYTVFGRIVTEESFQTLDKIAAVETKSPDRPIDAEQVRIAKVTIVNRSDVPNLLELENAKNTELGFDDIFSISFEEKVWGSALLLEYEKGGKKEKFQYAIAQDWVKYPVKEPTKYMKVDWKPFVQYIKDRQILTK